jgi:hypothetical protein
MNAEPLRAVPPLCECGCGLPVKTCKSGVWSRWRPGHHYRVNVAFESIRNRQARIARENRRAKGE